MSQCDVAARLDEALTMSLVFLMFHNQTMHLLINGAGPLEGLSERAPWGVVCRKTFDLEYKHWCAGLFRSLLVSESQVLKHFFDA